MKERLQPSVDKALFTAEWEILLAAVLSNASFFCEQKFPAPEINLGKYQNEATN